MALNAAGGWLVQVAHLAVPGSVVALIALAAMLELRVLPIEWVRAPAELLVRHLALLYVPAGVALLAYWGAVSHDIVAISAAALASLIAVFLVTAHIVQRLEREQ